MDKVLEEMKDFLEIVEGLLAELFQSGFDTVHDSTLQQLDAAASRAEQYGMEKFRELLSGLFHALEEQRHRTGGRDSGIFQWYGALSQYLYFSKKRLEIDEAASYIRWQSGKQQ